MSVAVRRTSNDCGVWPNFGGREVQAPLIFGQWRRPSGHCLWPSYNPAMAIKFKTNARKSLEVILWLANKRPGIDFHAILKLLFFADKRHLNAWGRPIVGDTYKALPYGPVAQTTYDVLKREPLVLEVLQLEDVPFDVVRGYHVYPRRGPNLGKLSESDVEALEQTWAEYSQLNFDQLTQLSHHHPAYKKAEQRGTQQMLYADFLEGENAEPEVIDDLKASAHRIKM